MGAKGVGVGGIPEDKLANCQLGSDCQLAHAVVDVMQVASSQGQDVAVAQVDGYYGCVDRPCLGMPS